MKQLIKRTSNAACTTLCSAMHLHENAENIIYNSKQPLYVSVNKCHFFNTQGTLTCKRHVLEQGHF